MKAILFSENASVRVQKLNKRSEFTQINLRKKTLPKIFSSAVFELGPYCRSFSGLRIE